MYEMAKIKTRALSGSSEALIPSAASSSSQDPETQGLLANMVAETTYVTQKGEGDEEVVAVTIDESTVPDWTEAEELAVKRKIDFTLLPVLGLAFFALQLDRGNIANALTSTLTKDLGVTTNQINVGGSLLSTGIVLLEIPSNIILQKVGPQRWLTTQIICWGIVATMQNFITNYAGFLCTRILLGLCEAGFIPGALYTLSTWYKKDESSLRISLFFLGNILAAATSALIGAGILSISGRYGIAGWRWLWIVEGCITIGVGLIFLLLLPPSVTNPSPLIARGKWSYFNKRQRYILVRRVLLDDPAKSNNKVHIRASDVWATVKNPRLLTHVLITLTATISVNAVQTYSPSIIKSLGFSTVRANAMFSVGNFIAAILVVTLGFIGDKWNRRGPVVLFGAIWSLIAYVCLRETIGHNKWRRYATVVAANSTNTVVHILNVAWLSANCQRPQQRSIAMAMIIMGANAAGIAGNQVFRTGDAPLYVHAFTAMFSLAAGCLVIVISLWAYYFFANRRMDRTGNATIIHGKADDGVSLEKEWRWTW